MEGRSDLLRTFTARSMAALLLTALVLGWVVTYFIRTAIVDEAAHATSVIGNTVVLEHLGNDPLAGPLDEETAAELDQVLEHGLARSGVFAMKLWDPEGTLVYSSVPEDEIGSNHAEDAELAAALRGETEVEIKTDGDDESANQFSLSGSLMEVYAPLRGAGAGPPVGVFELYQLYGPIDQKIREATLMVWLVILLGAVVTYAIQRQVVRRAAQRLLETERQVELIQERLSASLGRMEEHSLGTLAGLISAVDAKDSYTADHSLAVAEYSTAIGVQLGLSEDERMLLERAALLHDVGKIGIPEDILLKPARLDEAEREIVEDHSDMGGRIVGAIPFLQDLIPAIRHHHERWDGAGYPDGLSGETIPRTARIMAVADAFDAMTSDRPYRKALPVEVALDELHKHVGTQFDTEVVDALTAIIGRSGRVESVPKARALVAT